MLVRRPRSRDASLAVDQDGRRAGDAGLARLLGDVLGPRLVGAVAYAGAEAVPVEPDPGADVDQLVVAEPGAALRRLPVEQRLGVLA